MATLPPKNTPPNLKNGHRGAKFPFSECQNYTDKSISQIPPGGSKLGGWVPGQNQQTRGWRSSAWRNMPMTETKREQINKLKNKFNKFIFYAGFTAGPYSEASSYGLSRRLPILTTPTPQREEATEQHPPRLPKLYSF